MIIVHKPSGKTILTQVKYANSFLDRTIGLMFIPEMKGFDGLILEPCNSIHNFFVRFAIDVVFMDRDNKVVKIIRNFKPWRVSGIYLKAKKVLEMEAGKLDSDVQVGDELEVRGV